MVDNHERHAHDGAWVMLWSHPGETMMYAGIGLAIGLFVGGWVADRQRPP